MSPQQEKKLKRLAKTLDGGDVGVLTVIDEVENALESKIETLEKQIPALRQAEDGRQGEKGEPGESIKGDKGERGEKGEKGDSIKGDRGERGDRGEKGDTGERGEDGKDGADGFVDDATISYLEDEIKKTKKTTKKVVDDALGILDQRTQYLINKPTPKSQWGVITGTLSDQTDLQDVLDAKVDLAGDTMTGNLAIAPASGNAEISISKTAATGVIATLGLKNESDTLKFQVGLGSNTDDVFFVGRYNESGVYQDAPFVIDSITGDVTIANDLYLDGTSLSATYLKVANNLSDLNNTDTAQINLGLVDNFSGENLTIGPGAGASLVSGALQNIAVGADSLNSVTTGDYLIAIGADAMKNNTTGTYNCAIGRESMLTNVAGGYNTAIGIQTLRDSTSSRNLALGAWALYDNTSGSDNAAAGYAACFKQNNATAANNTGFGSRALFENLAGHSNTAIGGYTLYDCTSNYNTTVGILGLTNVTSGEGNVSFGAYAGDNITTGGYNTVIGSFVDAPSATGDQQLTICNLIFGTSTDGYGTTISSGDVGISRNTPTAKLDVWQWEAAGARPVLKLEQYDIDDTFINFAGTAAADGSRSISTDTTEDSAKYGAIRVEINGTTKWIRIYDNES